MICQARCLHILFRPFTDALADEMDLDDADDSEERDQDDFQDVKLKSIPFNGGK